MKESFKSSVWDFEMWLKIKRFCLLLLISCKGDSFGSFTALLHFAVNKVKRVSEISEFIVTESPVFLFHCIILLSVISIYLKKQQPSIAIPTGKLTHPKNGTCCTLIPPEGVVTHETLKCTVHGAIATIRHFPLLEARLKIYVAEPGILNCNMKKRILRIRCIVV